MKKLLIVQLDDAYFLFESLQVLEKHQNALKDYKVSILVDKVAFEKAYAENLPLIKGITFDSAEVLGSEFDVSVNLSTDEKSWDFHSKVVASHKIGPQRSDGVLCVEDLWSTFLLTLKNKTPFLTFHLQSIYRNILGIKTSTIEKNDTRPVSRIVYGASNTAHFPATEQEKLITGMVKQFEGVKICDISEIDLVEDITRMLYVGPATFEALKLCENGARGIFLSSGFQGFNLLPSTPGTTIISSNGKNFSSEKLLSTIGEVWKKKKSKDSTYSIYQIEEDVFNGPYLHCSGKSDLLYPFYQSHVVLWNLLLNLSDIELPITQCNSEQLKLLETYSEVLFKFIRLHEYALQSIDTIYHKSKAGILESDELSLKLKVLEEIDTLSQSLSASHSLLRQVFHFYKIRKAQGHLVSLQEEVQTSFLIYSEEHQALRALHELFSVTLKKNEVTI